jgi:hypothetical protein
LRLATATVFSLLTHCCQECDEAAGRMASDDPTRRVDLAREGRIADRPREDREHVCRVPFRVIQKPARIGHDDDEAVRREMSTPSRQLLLLTSRPVTEDDDREWSPIGHVDVSRDGRS